MKHLLTISAFLFFSFALKSQIITTIAGNGTAGFSGDGGAATSAQVYFPNRIAADNSGNIYFSDSQNQRIRKINASMQRG